MKHECSIVRDLLPLYAEGMLSQESTAFVKEHLENCDDCRAAYHGEVDIADYIDEFQPAVMSGGVFADRYKCAEQKADRHGADGYQQSVSESDEYELPVARFDEGRMELLKPFGNEIKHYLSYSRLYLSKIS